MVWVVTGLFCLIYAIIGLLGFFMPVPGVADLIIFAERFNGWELMLIGAVAIFFEGIYGIGNLIPGSTLAILIAVVALAHSPLMFIWTISAIFVGWCCATVVNVYVTARLLPKQEIPTVDEVKQHDRVLTTWYPIFRSSYEVAQVVAGATPRKVIFSSIKVKFYTSLGAALYAVLLPKFVDIYSITNNEGFRLVLVIATICLAVGGWLLWTERKTA